MTDFGKNSSRKTKNKTNTSANRFESIVTVNNKQR